MFKISGYGDNNNPTAKQWQSSYKRLIVHHEIKAGNTGNCISQDETYLITCEPKKQKKQAANDRNDDQINLIDENLISFSEHILSHYQLNVISYIAGYVIDMVQRKVRCEICKIALHSNEKVGKHFSLLLRKDRGGLNYPSKDVIQICTNTEKLLQKYQRNNCFFQMQNIAETIALSVMKGLLTAKN